MKLRYVGPSFGVDSLTNGKIYEATEEDGMYRVIDDSGEDYLYSMMNPAPLDGSSPGGKWEKVDDPPRNKGCGRDIPPKTVACPVVHEQIDSSTCFEIVLVADREAKPSILTSDITWNENLRQTCLKCPYHTDP